MTVSRMLTEVNIDISVWEDLVFEKCTLKTQLTTDIKNFEKSKIGYAELKWATHHMNNINFLSGEGTEGTLICPECGCICLSKATLI